MKMREANKDAAADDDNDDENADDDDVIIGLNFLVCILMGIYKYTYTTQGQQFIIFDKASCYDMGIKVPYVVCTAVCINTFCW